MPRYTSAEVRCVLTSMLQEELPGDGEPSTNYLRRVVCLLNDWLVSSERAIGLRGSSEAVISW